MATFSADDRRSHVFVLRAGTCDFSAYPHETLDVAATYVGQRGSLDFFLIILSNIKKINRSFVPEWFFDMMQGY